MSEAAVDGKPRLDFRAPCLCRQQRGPTAASIETGQRSTKEQEPRLQGGRRTAVVRTSLAFLDVSLVTYTKADQSSVIIR